MPIEDHDAIWDAATASRSATGYRLPTEMEWMWAAMGARDGATGYAKAFAGCTGNNAIGDYAWYGNSRDTTHPVGAKTANELGLHDLSGNVHEWCWDWYADSYPSGPLANYSGAASGTYRVLRGGSWGSVAAHCAVALRSASYPHIQSGSDGFRVVRP